MNTDRNNLAARFLLGKLSEEEALKLEEGYFTDVSLFEDVLSAENDLIDAYATGALSAEDRNLFESRLLLNPHQRRRVQFAGMLAQYASGRASRAEDFEPRAAAKSSWIAAAARLFSGKPLLSLSFSLAALLIFAGALWLALDDPDAGLSRTRETGEQPALRSAPEPPPAETKNTPTETAPPDAPVNAATPKNAPSKNAPQKREKPHKQAAPAVFSLILTPGLTRAAGESSRAFSVPPRTDLVKLRLTFETGGFTNYHAALETVEGEQIWSSNLKARGRAKTLEAAIPGKLLKKADYVLTLKALNKEGVYERVEDYTFTVK